MRILISIPLALSLTLMIFGFMAWLVEPSRAPISDPDSVLRFDVVQTEQERAAQRRQRQLPEPPEKPMTAPSQSPMSTPTPSQPLTAESIDLPEVNLDLAVSGMAIGQPAPIAQPTPAASPAPLVQNQQVMPLHRLEPRYPQRALQRKIEGFVVMEFTIDEKGTPQDIKVVEAEPARVFDREALRALARWKYQPMMVNGVATPRQGQTVKLEFKMQD